MLAKEHFSTGHWKRVESAARRCEKCVYVNAFTDPSKTDRDQTTTSAVDNDDSGAGCGGNGGVIWWGACVRTLPQSSKWLSGMVLAPDGALLYPESMEEEGGWVRVD
jgi:hypothetical protein